MEYIIYMGWGEKRHDSTLQLLVLLVRGIHRAV
jgi:hypothetical protein